VKKKISKYDNRKKAINKALYAKTGEIKKTTTDL